MPPKKTVKIKKDEVVEIPKASTLPDGPKTFFIGGWSAAKSLAALKEITLQGGANAPVHTVYVLPGVIEEGAAATIAARSVTVIAVSPKPLDALHADEKGAKAAEPAAEDAPPPQEDGGQEEDGGAAAEDETAKQPEKQLVVLNRSSTIRGAVTFTEAALPTPPPPPAAAEPAPVAPPKSALKDNKSKEKAPKVEVVTPAPVTPPENIVLPKEVGVRPSQWPTIKLSGLCFEGSVHLQGVHVTFEHCHFTASNTATDNLLSVSQYVKCTLIECTFSAPVKSAVYAFPFAELTAKGCTFCGVVLPSNVEDAKVRDAIDSKLTPQGAPVSTEAMAQYGQEKALAESRTLSVGIHCDNGKIAVEKCNFRFLTHGVLLRDRCEGSSVQDCQFNDVFGTAVMATASTINLKRCTFKECRFYALDCHGEVKGQVFSNDFGFSVVRLQKGARPQLHSNTCNTKVLDANDHDSIALQPQY